MPLGPDSDPSTGTFAPESRADRGSAFGIDTSLGTPRTFPDSAISTPSFLPTFGEYELLHLAGEGGMGVVYQARRRSTGEMVAIKTMKLEAGGSTELVQRFRREIRTADAVRHPNIVQVLEVGEENSRLYYTMPFVPTNLGRQRHLFREPRAAVGLISKVARALHHAHSQGVIHRDLKPANILLTAENEPLIADFGLARWLDASQALTQSLDPMGTPAYMAPEQASGPSNELAGTADVWSLGVILYELITSQRPFDAANPDALFYQIRNSNPPSPRSYRPEIDQSLEAIVMTCLSKDRASRYSTAAALADDLDRWLDGRPVRAQLKPISRLPVRLADNPRRPRNRILIALGMLIALGIGVFGIASYSTKTKDGDGIDWSSSVPTEEKLKWVETRLARGESVDLVPTSHNPRWFRLLSFDGKPLRFAEGSKPIALSGTDTAPALLELCRDPQTDNYVFEATLRQTETSRAAGCRVGLFCGYESLKNVNGNQTTLQWEVTFNDLIERRDGGIVVSVIMARQQEPARVQINQFMLNPAKVRFAPKGDPNRKERRKLKAQLLNGIMEVFFDGQSVGSIPLATLDDETRRAAADTGLAGKTSFNRRGGLGVVAYSATCEIIDCRLTPRSPEK